MSTDLTFSDGTTPDPRAIGFHATPDPWTFDFRSIDGRRRAYVFSALPCPALHADLKAAFATTVQRASSLTTVDQYFLALRRFLSFIGTLGEPFEALSCLKPQHFDQYRASRAVTVSAEAWHREVVVLFRLLRNAPYGHLSPELGEMVQRPGRSAPAGLATARRYDTPTPLYSQRELDQLWKAARQDVVSVLGRVQGGGRLLAAYRADQGSLSFLDQQAGLALDVAEKFGRSPHGKHPTAETAGLLGLTVADLAPLLVLATVLTTLRPSEVHDLPAAHTITEDGQVVQVRIRPDRRPGEVTVPWPVGGEADQLRRAGGFYLMVHQLTECARRASGSDRLWCVWTPSGPRVPGRPSLTLLLREWAGERRLVGDDGNPLPLGLHRLRSTVLRADGS